MTIGEWLARARRDAGLSIAEVSSQTRIKRCVIDDIEHDNYTACGGEYRARADIAAIAQALGVDSGPLIEAYDAATRPGDWIVATRSSEPITAAQAPEELTPRQDAEVVAAEADTEPITIGQPSEPASTSEPADPLMIGAAQYPMVPAETAIPAAASAPVRLAYADRLPFFWVALGGALLVVAALGGILLTVGAGGQPARPGLAVGGRHGGDRGAARPAHPARTRLPPGRSRGRTRPVSSAGSRPLRVLDPARIAAFGPGGTGQGDNPQLAHQALTGRAAAPWHSAWYTTAHFGNLQSGTGLLLDMGRSVTITSVRIALGNRPGADLTLRVGNSPALANLPPVAHANGAAGIIRLKTAPRRGRYVLVWFTRLPPDQAGIFQVSVYDIKLRGYP